MTASHEPSVHSLQRLLEFAAELQRLRSLVLGEAIPATLRESEGATENGDEEALSMAALLNPAALADPAKRLSDALVQFRALHLAEPTFAEVVMGFLVGLGKEYAETAEGADLLAGLHRSEGAEQLRRIWVALSLNTIDVDPQRSARSWSETVLDLALTGDLSQVGQTLQPKGLA